MKLILSIIFALYFSIAFTQTNLDINPDSNTQNINNFAYRYSIDQQHESKYKSIDSSFNNIRASDNPDGGTTLNSLYMINDKGFGSCNGAIGSCDP
jgi:hypothetical protein